ncbi:MAG TPA: SDR family oxidoreductase [Acidimicrobiales bacterium]|nr:SDR family oxidoreductase [Acidimicrobiales bacterium]
MILELFRLDGKVAIITGSGRGIGAASAVALAECGANVVIASRTQSDLDIVAELVAGTGQRAVSVVGDVGDLDVVRSLVTMARREFGRLDVVVNNAGGAIPLPFLDTTPEYLEEAFHFNVTTAHALNLVAVPLMLENGGGSIVNISSVMGRVAGRGYGAYGTVKAALSHYTRLTSKDLAPRIRVNAIAAGSTATSALEIVTTTPELKSMMEELTPLHRIASPNEMAAAVVYLASPAGAFLTGKVLEVDGGTDIPSLDFCLPDL